MFVTFEGPDGSGKTTALEKLIEWLNSENIHPIVTREPGSSISKENEKIRELIVDPNSELTDMVEAILFSADRRLHLEKLIWPSLKENKLVLCDRYFDSTFAYQGVGRGLGIDKMIKLQDVITEKTYPDFTFYFDLSVEESIARVDARGEKNRLDAEGKTFVERVHKGYHEVIKKFPERFIIIDASKDQDEVFEQLRNEFNNKILQKF